MDLDLIGNVLTGVAAQLIVAAIVINILACFEEKWRFQFHGFLTMVLVSTSIFWFTVSINFFYTDKYIGRDPMRNAIEDGIEVTED